MLCTSPCSEQDLLSCSGLEISYESTQIKGNSLLIKGIHALGTIPTNQGKNFQLTIKVPGLDEDSTALKIRMLPGMYEQGLSQDLETGCPKLPIVKFLGSYFSMETTLYSEHITYETGCPKLTIVKFLGSYFSMETTIYSEHITYDIVKKKLCAPQ